jgi:diguanylate cyclase (GGDEF)-like protein
MDIRTLLFADTLLQVCCAMGLLLMSRSVPGLRGLRWFGWAYASATAGLMLVIWPWALIGWWSVLLGRFLVLLGAVLMTQGIAEFAVPAASALGWGGFLLAFFAVADYIALRRPNHATSAVVVFACAFAAQLLVGIMVLLAHHEPAEKTAARTTATLLAGVATLSLARAALADWRGINANLLANDTAQFGGAVLYMVFSIGMAFGFVWMMTARLRNQLEMQARIDALTGVMNRRALDLAGQRELAACARRNSPLAVVAIDLDHFKRVNDVHGHAAGDAALTAAAQLLQRCLRNTDLLARFGGEEFVAVLPDRDAERAQLVAERLRGRMEALRIDYEHRQLALTASFGLAIASAEPQMAETWSDLLRRADGALYEAKRAGRNCIRIAAAPAPRLAASQTV